MIFGDGTQTRDFIYVEETAYWLRRIVDCDELVGKTINLGSGKETSVRELADLVYDEVAGSRFPPDFQPPRPGDVLRHIAGTAQAQQILGFRTRISIAEGISRLAAYLRANPDGAETLLARTQKFNWSPAEKVTGRS